MANVH
ncbi:3d7e537c-a841-4763-a672-38f61b8db08a [Thermothielavioides terrestris]